MQYFLQKGHCGMGDLHGNNLATPLEAVTMRPPEPPPGMVHRERVYRLLDRARDAAQAVWVEAPPGAGKTTLVAGYLTRRNLTTLWLRVTPRDLSAAEMLRLLVDAAERMPSVSASPPPSHSREAARPGALLGRLNELLQHGPRPLGLVVDGFEAAHADAHEAAARLLLTLPDGVTLFLLSRSRPPRVFTRLRRPRRMAVLGWKHLQLQPGEARELARRAGRTHIPGPVVDRLHEESGGWAAGFLLLLDAVTDAGGAARPEGDPVREAVAAYFSGRVLAGLCETALKVPSALSGGTPESRLPPAGPDQWPWQVRIHTLGRFALEAQGNPLSLAGKPPRRLLELLKLLVAAGDEGLSEARVIDAMWPDAEGDTGMRSLATNLHRLRALLRCEPCVLRTQGWLRLDTARVWVDAWAMERMLNAAEAIREAAEHAGRNPPPAYFRATEQALSLYRGLFLEGDDTGIQGLAFRDRLHSMYVRHLTRLAGIRGAEGRWDEAEFLYRRGLDVDPLAEPFYRGLMEALRFQGRRADALAAYERCRLALAEALDLAPSPETEAAIATLKAP